MPPTAITWNMGYATPVPLFGRNCIDPKPGIGLYSGQSMTTGDKIIMQYYLNDGLFETGYLIESLLYPTELSGSIVMLPTFMRPFQFIVIYNGKRRIGR